MRMLLILTIAASAFIGTLAVSSNRAEAVVCAAGVPWRWLRRTARGGRLSSLGNGWRRTPLRRVLNATLRYGFIVVRL